MTRRPRLSIVAAAVVLALGLSLSSALPAGAARISGQGVLVGSPFFSPDNVEILVKVLNAGRRPVQVEVQLRRASDFSILSSESLAIPPRTTGSPDGFFPPSDTPVVVTIRYATSGPTILRPSVQVVDPVGDTQIFADGFESGDVSR